MDRTENIKQLEKEILQQREEEQRILNETAAAVSLEFAQQAAGVLDSRKHSYGFEAYLILLDNLNILLHAGMPDSLALDSVQSGYDTKTILSMWRLSKCRQFQSSV